MKCRLRDLRTKEVINIHNGFRLGYVCDAVLETVDGRIAALIIPGHSKGLFGREEDYVIPFESIRRIGSDIILVESAGGVQPEEKKKRSWFHE